MKGKMSQEMLRDMQKLTRECGLLLRQFQARGMTRVPGIASRSRAAVPAERRTDAKRSAAPPQDLTKEARVAYAQTAAAECRLCRLAGGRRKLVFGSGPLRARIMFVGEGPGAEEDQAGLPFVGAAGRLLTRMLAAVGLDRDEVYITNLVKCRPPQNRTPRPDEIAACRPYLTEQMEGIAPDILVCLGRSASQTLLGEERGMREMRGCVHKRGKLDVVAIYHPSFLLRSPDKKSEAWHDLVTLAELAAGKGIGRPVPKPWWLP